MDVRYFPFKYFVLFILSTVYYELGSSVQAANHKTTRLGRLEKTSRTPAKQNLAKESKQSLKFKKRVIKKYYKLLAKQNQLTCSSKTSQKFNSLDKAYREFDTYIPMNDDQVDVAAIKGNVHLLREKVNWLRKKLLENERLRSSDYRFSLSALESSLKKIQSHIDQNLRLKYQVEVLGRKVRALSSNPKTYARKVLKLVNEILEKIPYVRGFNSPVNHQQNRVSYELEKNSLKRNLLFFRRKILEDGALVRNRNDRSFRAQIDNLIYQLKAIEKKTKGFFSYQLVEDLNWFSDYSAKVFLRGMDFYRKPLREWLARAESQFEFFKKILDDEKFRESVVNDRVKNRNLGRERLVAFVEAEKMKVYQFWAKQSEIYQYFYVVDQTLLNEVGPLDRSGLERTEVLKVLKKRRHMPKYNRLNVGQPLKELLSDAGNQASSRWLDVMFQQGQFSFTYPFIHGVKNIFCIDYGHTAKKLRRENLEIAYRHRNEDYNLETTPVRYFSRKSMFGRIDIAPAWQDYSPIDVFPEIKVGQNLRKKVVEQIKQGNFRFLMRFDQDSGKRQQRVRNTKATRIISQSKLRPNLQSSLQENQRGDGRAHQGFALIAVAIQDETGGAGKRQNSRKNKRLARQRGSFWDSRRKKFKIQYSNKVGVLLASNLKNSEVFEFRDPDLFRYFKFSN